MFRKDVDDFLELLVSWFRRREQTFQSNVRRRPNTQKEESTSGGLFVITVQTMGDEVLFQLLDIISPVLFSGSNSLIRNGIFRSRNSSPVLLYLGTRTTGYRTHKDNF